MIHKDGFMNPVFCRKAWDAMIKLKGKGVYGAVAIGRVSFYRREEVRVKRE